jgi:hypothetical protein
MIAHHKLGTAERSKSTYRETQRTVPERKFEDDDPAQAVKSDRAALSDLLSEQLKANIQITAGNTVFSVVRARRRARFVPQLTTTAGFWARLD